MEQQCWIESCIQQGVQPFKTQRTDCARNMCKISVCQAGQACTFSTDDQDDMWWLDLFNVLQMSLMDRINAAGRLLLQHHHFTSDDWSHNAYKWNWTVHVLIFGGVVTSLQEGSGLESPEAFLGGVIISIFSLHPWGFFLGTTASSHSPKTFIWGLIGYSNNPPSLKG